jgi:hypothetical protein
MATGFGDLPGMKNEDLVRASDGRQPVTVDILAIISKSNQVYSRDDEHGATLGQSPQCILDVLLGI